MKRAALSLETPYDTIHVFSVWKYLQLLADGGLEEESATKDSTHCIRVIKNHSFEWFVRQLGACGEYFVKHRHLPVKRQGVHKKIDSYIDD